MLSMIYTATSRFRSTVFEFVPQSFVGLCYVLLYLFVVTLLIGLLFELLISHYSKLFCHLVQGLNVLLLLITFFEHFRELYIFAKLKFLTVLQIIFSFGQQLTVFFYLTLNECIFIDEFIVSREILFYIDRFWLFRSFSILVFHIDFVISQRFETLFPFIIFAILF